MNKEMMMVSTLPIKPQIKTNIGMMIAPTIMDFIGNVFEIEKNIGFNILHTYSNKKLELDTYLNYVNNSGIKYDSIFIDENKAQDLLEIIYQMYINGFIKEKEEKLLRCECGMVDMIYSPTNSAKLYTFINEKPYCNHCKKECKASIEKSLVFEIDRQIEDMSIVPLYLKKEIEELSKKFVNTDILVSKKRNTGYSLNINNKMYNIDIDFLWSNYFKLYNKKRQIYIASNHQIFNMYLMSYLSKITSTKELMFIASPYIKTDLDMAKKQYELRKMKEYKALLLLYNLKWKGKDCIWSDSVMNYLIGISNTKIENLYKAMILSSRDMTNNIATFDECVFEILNNETRMQTNIKTMKKLYKEERL